MDDTGGTYVVQFDVPPQLLLNEEFEAMAWDHALKTAHEAGVIPVGPIIIETETVQNELGKLIEGQPLRVQSMMEALTPREVVRVTATMMIGSKI